MGGRHAALTLMLAASAQARAQPVFHWNAPANGHWTDSNAWGAPSYPSCLSPCSTCSATARLGGGHDAYTVKLDETIRVHTLDMNNPHADLIVEYGYLSICGSVTGPGTIRLSSRASLCLDAPGSELDARVIMTGSLAEQHRTEVIGFSGSPTRAKIGKNGEVSGIGTIGGELDIHGTVIANPGDSVRFAGQFRGPGRIVGNGGRFRWGTSRFSDLELAGDIIVGPTETLRIGDNIRKHDQPLQLGIGTDLFFSNQPELLVEDSAILQLPIFLNGVPTAAPPDPKFGAPVARGALILGPVVADATAVLGTDSAITGTGSIVGYFRFDGLVAPGPRGQIDILPGGRIVTGSGELREDGGQILWRDTLFQHIRLGGSISVEPGETPKFGPGVTLTDPPLVVGDGSVTTRVAWVDLQPGATLDVPVLLRGLHPPDARLRGPTTGTGPFAALGPGVEITGTGVIAGRLDCLGCSLSPGIGSEPGEIEIRAPLDFSLTDRSTLTFDLLGTTPDAYDRITGTAPKRLAGTLIVRAPTTLAPPIGTSFDLLTGPEITRQFDTVTIAPLADPSRVLRLRQTSTAVGLVATCAADLDADLQVDSQDLALFLAAFLRAHPDADLNADGQTDSADIQIFVGQFLSGCGA
jgi:hypothetical protein